MQDYDANFLTSGVSAAFALTSTPEIGFIQLKFARQIVGQPVGGLALIEAPQNHQFTTQLSEAVDFPAPTAFDLSTGRLERTAK